MGQQCTTNSTADNLQLGKKTGSIKITGNNESLYNPQNKSVYHFEKSVKSSRLNSNVSRMNASLGNFIHSSSFDAPKGTVQASSYVLNQEGLLCRQNSEWKNGMPHGMGQLIYPDASYYIGYMVNGIPHGQGRFISADGWYYEGQLQNQQAEGDGKFAFEKHAFQYQGHWAGDLPDGFGRQTWTKKNGTIAYQGQFLNGVKHGSAKYSSSQFSYEGTFQRNIINGKGHIVYRNGQVYRGDFVNGKKHGHGVYRWPDHSTFQGQYLEDRKHGLGRFTYSNGKTFEGHWRYGKRQGQGVVVFNDKNNI